MKKTLRIWDLPTRLFHWLLVICIAGAVICVNIGGYWMQWHAYCGYAALSLVLFRVLWGFIGAVHSRFTTFVPSPQRLIAFLRGKEGSGLGHNPLGSLSVIALLLVVGICIECYCEFTQQHSCIELEYSIWINWLASLSYCVLPMGKARIDCDADDSGR